MATLKDVEINQVKDGEWIDITDGQYVGCCDCGLVHRYEYKILHHRNKILQQVNEEPELTKQLREQMGE